MFFHVVRKKAVLLDRYLRVYIDDGRLYFVQVGGDFYNQKAFEAATGDTIVGRLLFYFPYRLAQKMQEKRCQQCDELVAKKAFMTLLQKSANFKIEFKEVTKLEFRSKGSWNRFWSNHGEIVRIHTLNGKIYRFEVPFGESVENIISNLEKTHLKIENKIAR
ncbi:hypothetical protein HB852_15205 [Listeria grandensis]|uniref:hypothetical protein n=1 Tax=Listeria grandensis TaxID=1494963 RepID=UPI00162508AB|nr:hypothetical protein [Listeria grandensis]MBC1475963.1 hypothetical protein [Listeria grandensis]